MNERLPVTKFTEFNMLIAGHVPLLDWPYAKLQAASVTLISDNTFCMHLNKAPSKLSRGRFENGGFTLKSHLMFCVHIRRRILKTKQSALILDLCLGKIDPSPKWRPKIQIP